MTRQPISRLRFRLTAWYATTFFVILAFLGGAVLYAIELQLQHEGRQRLQRAAEGVRQAVLAGQLDEERFEDARLSAASGTATPAMYLFDVDGRPLDPTTAEPWMREGAALAGRTGNAWSERSGPHGEQMHFYASRFTLANGEQRVAGALVGGLEYSERYRSLILVFVIASLTAVLLVAAGGWFMVRASTAPIEASMEQMRRFVADAAHELRTPLAVLQSRTEVALQQPRDNQTYAATLREIARDAQSLGRVVEDLFTLARADAGERPLRRERLSLDDIVLDAAAAARAMADAKGVKLVVDEYEEARVDGDPTTLRALVMILLDNAIKFTPAGRRVSVRVGAAQSAPVLIVKDEGVGIDPEHMPHIFDRFYRADPARSREAPAPDRGGAGLGLSIAQWIAGAHGARIDVESTLHEGSTFTVRFPAVASRASGDETAPAATRTTHHAT